jgi:hypothetical protein
MKTLNGIVLITFLTLLWSSCKKDEITEFDRKYSVIKIYNDTIGDPSNGSARIIAGNNRLYMTYGKGSIFINGNDVFTSKLLVTDLEGNFITTASLPDGLGLGDILVLDDGSVWIAAINPNDFSTSTIYLLHYTADASLISLDTIVPGFCATTGCVGFDLYYNLRLCRSVNGNPLLYGVFYDANSQNRGYMLECDSNGKELWSKALDHLIGGCIATADGGYLYNFGDNIAVQIGLTKCDAQGNVLWSNSNDAPGGNYNVRYLIPTIAGNFLELIYYWNGANYVTDLYQLDSNGDTLNSIQLGKSTGHFVNALISRDDGSIFTIANDLYEGSVSSNGLFDQFNTYYTELDADLKIKNNDYFQQLSTDLIVSACKMPDGRIACFGIYQSFHRDYYKPELIIIN